MTNVRKRRKLVRIGGLAALLAAVCMVAALAQAGHSSQAAPQGKVYPDEQGDSGQAPDIASVTVSNTTGGDLTFVVNIANRQGAWPGNESVVLVLNTDQNFATGDPSGWDYELALFGGDPAPLLRRWNPSLPDRWEIVKRDVGSFAAPNLTFTVNAADTGVHVAKGLYFYVFATHNGAEDVGLSDYAPSDARKGALENHWTYAMDADGDGVADAADRCPGQSGPAATGGCPDGDGDGVVDARDKCPKQRAKAAFDRKRTGCTQRLQPVIVLFGGNGHPVSNALLLSRIALRGLTPRQTVRVHGCAPRCGALPPARANAGGLARTVRLTYVPKGGTLGCKPEFSWCLRPWGSSFTIRVAAPGYVGYFQSFRIARSGSLSVARTGCIPRDCGR